MNTILVVEDLPIVREPLSRLLRSEGFQVFSAGNGVQALEVLRRNDVDLILMDVMMPKMDGVALLECIRANPCSADLPVIALTAILDSGRLERLRELGVKSILAKGSFTFDHLIREVRSMVREVAAPRGG